jgi:hypothetical protein
MKPVKEMRCGGFYDAIWYLKNRTLIEFDNALGAFAGVGGFRLRQLIESFDNVVAMDIRQDYLSSITKSGSIYCKCCDSIEYLNSSFPSINFDFIHLDNPFGLFGPDSKYCEHFDCLIPAVKHLTNLGAILTYVISSPYEHDEPRNAGWIDRRRKFYGECYESMTVENLTKVYQRIIEEELKKSTSVRSTQVTVKAFPRYSKDCGDSLTDYYFLILVGDCEK